MKLYQIIFLMVFCACSSKETVVGNFSMKPQSKIAITIDSLQFKTIYVDNLKTSYIGESGILKDGQLYFFDNYLCKMYIVDTQGNYISSKLGKGRARNEIMSDVIQGHSISNDGKMMLFDATGKYYVYDDNMQKVSDFRIIYDRNYDKSNIYQDSKAYSQRYNDIVCRNYNDNLFMNVTLAHLDYNIIDTQKEHLDKCGNILEVDMPNAKLDRILADGYPKSYKTNPNTKAVLSAVKFDIGLNGDFYVTYEADSLLYIYDSKYIMKGCYGYQGKNMQLNYKEAKSIKDVGTFYREERNNKGYYNWVEYEDKTGILFRSYQKGTPQLVDGLQIYKDGVLIGDVEVPKSFRVMGYIKPYYYSYIIADEEEKQLYFYKFKL